MGVARPMRHASDPHFAGGSGRDKSCTGKVRSSDMAEALRAAKRMRKNLGGKKFDAYACGWCGWFHIGRHRTDKELRPLVSVAGQAVEQREAVWLTASGGAPGVA